MDDKLAALQELLGSYGRVAIGYSGGVDSTFLAAVCARTIPDDTLLVHLSNAFIASPERRSFARDAGRFGLPVAVLDTDPLADPVIAANPVDRCYHCKLHGFAQIVDEARRRGYPTVLEGSNADDAEDFRPGMRAIRELGVRSPLMETGWHKDEERALLRVWGYAVWDMPAGACLATRVPCGEPLTASKLELIRTCEDYLHELGLRQVRARLIGGSLQVEAAPEDLARLSDGALPERAIAAFRAAGAEHVDPVVRPYRHGGMNG